MHRLNILVTGATGFIGSKLVKKLSVSGHNVMGLTRSNGKKLLNENIQWLEADLSVPASYRDQVKAFKPNVVIHTAAIKHIDIADKYTARESRVDNKSLPS